MPIKLTIFRLSLALTTALTVGCQSTYSGAASSPGSATQSVGSTVMGAAPAGFIAHPDNTVNEFGTRGP